MQPCLRKLCKPTSSAHQSPEYPHPISPPCTSPSACKSLRPSSSALRIRHTRRSSIQYSCSSGRCASRPRTPDRVAATVNKKHA
jgi:hypothetical protein